MGHKQIKVVRVQQASQVRPSIAKIQIQLISRRITISIQINTGAPGTGVSATKRYRLRSVFPQSSAINRLGKVVPGKTSGVMSDRQYAKSVCCTSAADSAEQIERSDSTGSFGTGIAQSLRETRALNLSARDTEANTGSPTGFSLIGSLASLRDLYLSSFSNKDRYIQYSAAKDIRQENYCKSILLPVQLLPEMDQAQ